MTKNTQQEKGEKKIFKVEAKGSLWEVSLEYGCYSDWHIEHYIFSGNTEDEVWGFIKLWAKNGGIGERGKQGLVWGDKKFQFAPAPDWSTDDKLTWDTSYGDAYEVNIKRAEVIYVNP